jgi:four helix bundle protein
MENGKMEKGLANMKPGKIESFEDLQVWQLAVDLAAVVYSALAKSRDFSFRDQMQRAAVSISSNIAEGYERDSNADFIRFLYYAKGSCGEIRSQFHVASRVGMLSEQSATTMIEEARLLSQKLGAYIKVRETRFS